MHVNILQCWHYVKKYKRHAFENVLIITPNEGLSKQHIVELNESSIPCEMFNKQGGGMFAQITNLNYKVEKVIDENKSVKTKSFSEYRFKYLILVVGVLLCLLYFGRKY